MSPAQIPAISSALAQTGKLVETGWPATCVAINDASLIE
jgi:hypothetical protein